MGWNLPIDQVVCQIHGMDRTACIDALTDFADMRLDFDRPYLESMDDDRLRHILLAAVLTVRKRRVAV